MRWTLTRKRLLEAACELFIQHGIDNTSIDDIVAGAEISRATFYLHFRAKADLIEALAQDMEVELEGQYERLAQMGGADIDALTQWFADYLRTCREDRRIVFVLMCVGPAEGYFSNEEYYERVIDRLGPHIPAFSEAKHDPLKRASAKLFLFELEGMLRHMIVWNEQADLAPLCRAAAANLYNFIHSASPPRASTAKARTTTRSRRKP